MQSSSFNATAFRCFFQPPDDIFPAFRVFAPAFRVFAIALKLPEGRGDQYKKGFSGGKNSGVEQKPRR